MVRQYGGDIQLANGGSIHLRGFSHFNLELWDEVLKPFQPLTQHDMLLLAWGAWSLRYNVWRPATPWEGWKQVTCMCRACSAPTVARCTSCTIPLLQPGTATACLCFWISEDHPSAAWHGRCMHVHTHLARCPGAVASGRKSSWCPGSSVFRSLYV